MGIADLSINGSYLAYVFVVLLQISILYLQRPDLNRRLHEKNQKPSASSEFYSVATGFIGTGLNWLSWLLSAYVAKEFGPHCSAASGMVAPPSIASTTRLRKSSEYGFAIHAGLLPVGSLNHIRARMGIPDSAFSGNALVA